MRQRNILSSLLAKSLPRLGTRRRIRARLGPVFGSCCYLFFSAALLASISVFDSEETFWAFSRDIFYRALAPLYPGTQDREASVVLLNDESFRSFDTYPVKYQTHASVLRAIASYSPRAIFIDFAFIDKRPDPTIDDLKQVFEELKGLGIRTYVATHRRYPNDPGIRADLSDLVKKNLIEPVSFNLGRSLWGTPLYVMESGGMLTASAQIMKDFYPLVFMRNLQEVREFEIWWGLPPAQINCARAKDSCGARYSLMGRLLSAIDFKLLPLDIRLWNDVVKLPYAPTLYVNEVLDGNKRTAIDSALRGKFVFYGPDLEIARDNYPNPVFSYRSEDDRVLPGVFFHAMALENMIDLRERVKIPRSNQYSAMWRRDVLSISIVCLLLFLYRAFAKQPSKLKIIGVIVCASGAIALIEFFYFNLAPSNWIGVFSFVTIAHVAHADEGFKKLADRLASYRSG
jgi:CHASE2 domain-containing sensor protein